MNCQKIHDLVKRMSDDRSPHTCEAQQMLTKCAINIQQIQNLERVWRARHSFQTAERFTNYSGQWELAADELSTLIGN